MRAPVLTVLFAVACASDEAPEDGRADVVNYHVLEGLPAHSPEVIDRAADTLGLDLVHDQTAPGAIVITMGEAPIGDVDGHTDKISLCEIISWSVDDGRVLAHEIGHALGLHHVNDEFNLMYPYELVDNPDLTDDQVDTMRHTAWRLQHECS